MIQNPIVSLRYASRLSKDATKVVTKSQESIKDIHGVDVIGFKAVVENGNIKEIVQMSR